MCDPLRLAVFKNPELLRFEVRDVMASGIGDYRIHLHQVDGHPDHGAVRGFGELWPERRRPEQQ